MAGWVWVRPLVEGGGVRVSRDRWWMDKHQREKGESKQWGTVWQHEEQNVRVVDENVKLAAGDLGNLLVAGLDALGVGDVEGEGTHAHVGHLGQDGWVAGRCDDMDAFMVKLLVFCLMEFDLKATGGMLCNSGYG